jgi:hypothetical protein
MSMLPEDPEGYLRRFKQRREGQDPDAPPATTPPAETQPRRSDAAPPAGTIGEQRGYDRTDRVGMQQLLDSAAPKTR